MRNTLIVLWLILRVEFARSNAGIFSKFSQHDYKVEYKRAEVEYCDEKYATVKMITFKYNRTQAVTNITTEFHIDLGYDLDVLIDVYKWTSNEYRDFPIHFRVNFCSAIEFDVAGMAKYYTCPLVRGRRYDMFNFYPEESHLPPYIPTGQYKISSTFIYREKNIYKENYYAEAHRSLI